METEVFFDITKEEDNYAEGDLIILHEGHYRKYSAMSGKYGKGSLPKGQYEIVSCFIKPNDGTNDSFKKEGFPWIAGIKPMFPTDRFDLAIHPDGKNEGTNGCIGIEENDLDAYETLNYMLSSGRSIIMKVV